MKTGSIHTSSESKMRFLAPRALGFDLVGGKLEIASSSAHWRESLKEAESSQDIRVYNI